MLILVPELALALLNRNIQPRGNEGGRTNDAKGEKVTKKPEQHLQESNIRGEFGGGRAGGEDGMGSRSYKDCKELRIS